MVVLKTHGMNSLFWRSHPPNLECSTKKGSVIVQEKKPNLKLRIVSENMLYIYSFLEKIESSWMEERESNKTDTDLAMCKIDRKDLRNTVSQRNYQEKWGGKCSYQKDSRSLKYQFSLIFKILHKSNSLKSKVILEFRCETR